MISKAGLVGFAASLACTAVLALSSLAKADSLASVKVVAVVASSATLTITDSAGPASQLDFKGSRSESVGANEGAITVTAMISTTVGNGDTQIQVKSTDLVGQVPGDIIPATALSYTHTTDTGGGSWLSGTLSTNWTTLAKLTPGSGVYTGEQDFTLNIPPTANNDTYIGTISYQVVGF